MRLTMENSLTMQKAEETLNVLSWFYHKQGTYEMSVYSFIRLGKVMFC